MLKDFFLSFRDYCYNEIKANKDENTADSNHGILFGGGLALYYLTIPLAIILIIGRFGFAFSPTFRSNILLRAMMGILMIYPCFHFVKLALNKMSKYPIDKNWSQKKLKSLRFFYLFVIFFGFIFMISTLWLLTQLLYH